MSNGLFLMKYVRFQLNFKTKVRFTMKLKVTNTRDYIGFHKIGFKFIEDLKPLFGGK